MLPYESPWMDDDLRLFRENVARFVETEMVPNDAKWRAQHGVGKEIWRKAGEMGLIDPGVDRHQLDMGHAQRLEPRNARGMR